MCRDAGGSWTERLPSEPKARSKSSLSCPHGERGCAEPLVKSGFADLAGTSFGPIFKGDIFFIASGLLCPTMPKSCVGAAFRLTPAQRFRYPATVEWCDGQEIPFIDGFKDSGLKIALLFVRNRRFFSPPSAKFTHRRKNHPYPCGKRHYVFGQPPLGVMYLSAVLKAAGHEVSVTDQCHPEYSDERFVRSLAAGPPDLVGISVLSNMDYPAAVDLTRRIKRELPAVRIVMGGVFATINADKIIASEKSIDVVGRGEGEGIILDLAEGTRKLQDIPGLCFRDAAGAVVTTEDREGIPDLDSLPFPDRDCLDIHYVASLPLDVPAVIWDRPYTTLLSSRGCPFHCSYCNCPTFSRGKYRARSAGNVLKELESIGRQGYGAFCFVDDNFLLNPKRAVEICDGLTAGAHSFRWACEGRVNGDREGLFRKLSGAGCDMIMFGVESGSQRVLDSMNKGTRLHEIKSAVKKARGAGIGVVHGFFIVGSPGETVGDLKQTFRFANSIGVNSFAFNSLTAFRGTPLWSDEVARGLIDEKRDWGSMFPVHAIDPTAIDSKTLFKLRSRLVRRLILSKLARHPVDGARILGRFLDCMSLKDLYRLLTSSTSDHTRART